MIGETGFFTELEELPLRLGENLGVPSLHPPPDGVLSSLHWHGPLLKLGCKSLLTAWGSAAVEY